MAINQLSKGNVRVGKLSGSGIVGTTQIASNAVTSAKLDVAIVQYAEVAITNAELRAIRATPKTLVAARVHTSGW